MGGASGRTHCGRWTPADYDVHGTGRLVCSLPAYHRGHRQSAWSGWYWLRGEPIRRAWHCTGRLGTCDRVVKGTETEARVKGWRIGRRLGAWDPLCPWCGAPDPATVALCRELERSVSR
jgi:hypothetical protein